MCHFHFPNAIALTNVIALMHGSLFTLIVSLTLFVHKIVWFVLFDSSHKSRTKFHLIPILNHANVEMLRIFNGTVTKATNSTEFLIDRAIYSDDFILFCRKKSVFWQELLRWLFAGQATNLLIKYWNYLFDNLSGLFTTIYRVFHFVCSFCAS